MSKKKWGTHFAILQKQLQRGAPCCQQRLQKPSKPDGKKEIIDFRQVHREPQSAWEAFLHPLCRQELEAQSLELIIIDGGSGLLAALPLVYGDVPIQRCWAHKTHNIPNHVNRVDQKKPKKTLNRVTHPRDLGDVHKAAQRFVARWQTSCPEAVQSLSQGLPELLSFF